MSTPMSCKEFWDLFDPRRVPDADAKKRFGAWLAHEESCPKCAVALLHHTRSFGITNARLAQTLRGWREIAKEYPAHSFGFHLIDVGSRSAMDENEREYYIACLLQKREDEGHPLDYETARRVILHSERSDNRMSRRLCRATVRRNKAKARRFAWMKRRQGR